MSAQVRGIYHYTEEESFRWRRRLSQFPYHTPCFHHKSDLYRFLREYCCQGSNPDRPEFTHIYTLLTEWNQIDRYILQYLTMRYTQRLASSSVARISSPFTHQILTSLQHYKYPRSKLSTMRYVFNEQRCGIFVKVYNNQVVLFCPIANEDYQNRWGNQLTFDSVDGTSDTYYQSKAAHAHVGDIIPDKTRWWKNGHVLDNERVRNPNEHWQVWMDFFLVQIREMLEATCHHHYVPDVEFFINKRDSPQMPIHVASGKIPVLSFYGGNDFADVMIPTTECWESCRNVIYPSSAHHRGTYFPGHVRDFRSICMVPWEKRIPTAVFRGVATGKGTTVMTNQRLRVAQIDHEVNDPTFLDAKLTGINSRDKVGDDGKVRYIQRNQLPFKVDRNHYIPMADQAKYKYVIYIDGHSAASRMSLLLRMGACILKVGSICNAPNLWYSHLLKPWEHYIPIKPDLSDLVETIHWCHNNDSLCNTIANNAYQFYKHQLNQDTIMLYMKEVLHQIHLTTDLGVHEEA